ncbi:sigma-70 family RNA polymerase sigma factor [Ruminococcus sp. YE282]|uniref:RNA polymerase sigma factor n=1 Tax=Ruminococcus sp. YE282 TaxID=3158780 RepID=UPI0008801D2B|nr:RNA polymerase sigma factor, sigma-70 family [Ruminococcus bromii]
MKQLWINGEYIDVTDEIYTVYLKGQRKMNYFEKDLKSERVIKDKSSDIKKIIPSREDSLDRLLSDNKRQFSDDSESVESIIQTNDEIDKLHNALNQLSADEWAIIKMLFYDEMSERDTAKVLGISQVAVNKRKHRILKKLKKIINL